MDYALTIMRNERIGSENNGFADISDLNGSNDLNESFAIIVGAADNVTHAAKNKTATIRHCTWLLYLLFRRVHSLPAVLLPAEAQHQRKL